MMKLILAFAALLWFGDHTLPMFANVELLRDSAIALVIASMMQPWVVNQLEG